MNYPFGYPAYHTWEAAEKAARDSGVDFNFGAWLSEKSAYLVATAKLTPNPMLSFCGAVECAQAISKAYENGRAQATAEMPQFIKFIWRVAFTMDHSFNNFERFREDAKRLLNGDQAMKYMRSTLDQAGVGASAKTKAACPITSKGLPCRACENERKASRELFTREVIRLRLLEAGVVTRTASDFRQLVDDIFKMCSV